MLEVRQAVHRPEYVVTLCVCVCVFERGSEREGERYTSTIYMCVRKDGKSMRKMQGDIERRCVRASHPLCDFTSTHRGAGKRVYVASLDKGSVALSVVLGVDCGDKGTARWCCTVQYKFGDEAEWKTLSAQNVAASERVTPRSLCDMDMRIQVPQPGGKGYQRTFLLELQPELRANLIQGLARAGRETFCRMRTPPPPVADSAPSPARRC